MCLIRFYYLIFNLNSMRLIAFSTSPSSFIIYGYAALGIKPFCIPEFSFYLFRQTTLLHNWFSLISKVESNPENFFQNPDPENRVFLFQRSEEPGFAIIVEFPYFTYIRMVFIQIAHNLLPKNPFFSDNRKHQHRLE